MNVNHENEDGSVTITRHFSKERVDSQLHGIGVREHLHEMEQLVKAWFKTAGFEVSEVFRLENQYWGYGFDDASYRISSPWWLVETNIGKIILGPRKRVWAIDWSRTDVRGVVTDEDITKGDDYVHSYSHADTVKYLAALYKLWDAQRLQAIREQRDADG